MLFLLPNFLGFLLFTLWPILASFALSFCSWDLLTPIRFVGWSNFVNLLGFIHSERGWEALDANFWKFLWNTLFMMLNLPINMAGSLALAMLLNRKLAGSTIYRLIFHLPHIVAGVAVFYLWRWMFNADYGLINTCLARIGIIGPKWLTDAFWSKPALMLVSSWLSIGGTSMILYLAALQGVSKDLLEASEIDGANAWQRFRAVTWPAVQPVTFFILTLGLIHGFQSGFEMAYVMTGGGPYGETTTLGYYIYSKAYVHFQMGYASAIAWVLFFLVFLITLINWKFGPSRAES